MTPNDPNVYIVEDDPQAREDLIALVRSAGWRAEACASVEEFLETFANAPTTPSCLVFHVQLEQLSEQSLQDRMAAEVVQIPIIIIAGSATVPIVVRAMRAGAVDFFETPLDIPSMLAAIRRALDRDVEIRRRQARVAASAAHLELLSPREREVLKLLLEARSSKQVGVALGISVQTVAKHRASILEKLQAESLLELVRKLMPEDDRQELG